MGMNEQQKAAHDGVIAAILAAESLGEVSLVGYAGTGKTFTVSHIKASAEAAGLAVMMVAPTNKAVKVLNGTKASGGSAMTVCKALGIRVDGAGREHKTKAGPQLDGVDLLMVDESSMVSERSREQILEEARKVDVGLVLWIGDDAQLPPIEDEGRISPALRCERSFRLTKIERGDPKQCAASVVGARIRVCIQAGTRADLEALVGDGEPLPGVSFVPHIARPGESADWLDPATSHLGMPSRLLIQALGSGMDARVVTFTNESAVQAARDVRIHYTGDDLPVAGETMSFVKPYEESDGGHSVVVYSTDEEVTAEEVYGPHQCAVSGLEYINVKLLECGRILRVPRRIDDWLELVRKTHARKRIASEQQDMGLLKESMLILVALSLMTDLRSVLSSTTHKAQGSTYEVCIVDMHNIQRSIRNGFFDTYNRMLYVAVTRPSVALVVVF